MSRLEFDGWAGPEPAGQPGRALLARVARVIPHGITAAMEQGRVPDAAYLLLGHPQGDALICDTLAGWTMPLGMEFGREWYDKAAPAEVIECAQIAITVWVAAGFFGQQGADRFRAALAKSTPTSD